MNARAVALKVLGRIEAEGAYANLAVPGELAQSTLDERDRRFVTELAYGTIERRRWLDYQLAPYIGARAARLPAMIAEILRLTLTFLFVVWILPQAPFVLIMAATLAVFAAVWTLMYFRPGAKVVPVEAG